MGKLFKRNLALRLRTGVLQKLAPNESFKEMRNIMRHSGTHTNRSYSFTFALIIALSLLITPLMPRSRAAVPLPITLASTLTPLLSPVQAACVTPPSNMVAWYPGDGNTEDIRGTNDGLAEGGVTFPAGKVAQAFGFNGTTADVKIPASPFLDVGAGNGVTIDAWINPTTISQRSPLVEWNNGTTYGVHLWMSVDDVLSGGVVGNLYVNLRDTTGDSHIAQSSAAVLTANTYQHVALTYDKTNGNVALYVNGVAVAMSSTNLGFFNPQTSYDVYLGARVAQGTGRYSGQMDEVEFFDRALSQSEIQSIFNAGSAGKCKTTPTPSPSPSPSPCTARADACLDGTFDADGKVLSGQGRANAAALQPDGKIVLAGDNGDVFQFDNNDFVLRRYNADGSPDTNFGVGGTVTTDYFGGADVVKAIVTQPDNKIVAVGGARENGSTGTYSLALARYNPNGSLDTSFGAGGVDGDGKVTTDFFGNTGDNIAYSIAIQPDGKLVAAGSTEIVSGNNTTLDFALARYNTDGTLDPSFGAGGVDGDGKVTTDFFNNLGDDTANSITLQPDGKIIAAGTTEIGANSGNFDVALARYNAAGSLDSTFDSDGKVTTDFGDRDSASDVALQPDGKVVAVGKVQRGFFAGDFLLARYNANGSLDSSLDGDGKVLTDFSNFDAANAVVIQSDGRLVVAGTTETCTGNASSASGRDFGLARYNSNGSLDASFGVNGRLTIDFSGRQDGASAVFVQPDGKFVAAGTSEIPGGFNFALARYALGGTCPGATPSPSPSPSPSASPSSPPPATGEIAFVGFRAPGQGIFVMNADGSFQTRRTTNTDQEPSFSPDGTRIAFVSSRDGNSEIYIMNADGSNPTRLTNNPGLDRNPTFSPDSQRIAFMSGRDSFPDGIYMMNADGTNQTRLSPNNTRDLYPSFSGDGTRIAFTSQRTSQNEIWVMNSNGTNPVQLTNTAPDINDLKPCFSPDGTRIAFERSPNIDPFGNAEIYVMNADGTGQTRLTNNSSYDSAPSFSPNGTRIAFESGRTGKLHIWVMNADGTNPIQLTNDTSGNMQPSWGGGGRLTPGTSTIQFSAASYDASEGPAFFSAQGVGSGEVDSLEAEQAAAVGAAVVQVTRSGDLSQPAEVEYATAPGTAGDRTDYTAAYGTLRFAAGETSKSLVILVTDDVFAESPESFTVALSNPVGVTLGTPSSATLVITSNDTVTGQNPVRDLSFDNDRFVRYTYADFLNRLPDTAGHAFWKNQIDECETRPPAERQGCREVRRINVSAAFFLSIEFQETGYLVYRFHQAAFDTGEQLLLRRFLHDTQEIRSGIVVGQGNWEQQLEQNRQLFALRFVSRAEFRTLYPLGMSPAAFVDALNANTGNSLSQTERNALVTELSGNNTNAGRASVLRKLADDNDFRLREFNRAFVLMQYFGYLRRNPPDPPDLTLDFQGYNYWLTKLNHFNGSFFDAEMVKAFILSHEYVTRFGP